MHTLYLCLLCLYVLLHTGWVGFAVFILLVAAEVYSAVLLARAWLMLELFWPREAVLQRRCVCACVCVLHSISILFQPFFFLSFFVLSLHFLVPLFLVV